MIYKRQTVSDILRDISRTSHDSEFQPSVPRGDILIMVVNMDLLIMVVIMDLLSMVVINALRVDLRAVTICGFNKRV